MIGDVELRVEPLQSVGSGFQRHLPQVGAQDLAAAAPERRGRLRRPLAAVRGSCLQRSALVVSMAERALVPSAVLGTPRLSSVALAALKSIR